MQRRLSSLMSKVISVNVNGLGENLKLNWIRELIRESKANFLFLQESHVACPDLKVLKLL